MYIFICCRRIGQYSQASYEMYTPYGQIWSYNVLCNGTESSIFDCDHWGRSQYYYCSHYSDVYISCIPSMQQVLKRLSSKTIPPHYAKTAQSFNPRFIGYHSNTAKIQTNQGKGIRERDRSENGWMESLSEQNLLRQCYKRSCSIGFVHYEAL